MKSEFIMPSVPNQREIRKEGESLVDRTNTFKIDDEDGFVASWAMVEAHDKAMKRVGEVFDPFVSGLHNLHKMAVALRDGFLEPLVLSKTKLLDLRGEYRREQERLQKIIDDKKAEALRAQQKKDLERLAKKTEKTGDVEAAAVIRQEAATLPIPAIAPTPAVPKSTGSVVKTTWKFEIVDEDKVERAYCSPDDSKIRKVVQALGDKAPIAGIRIWKETKEHSRGAA